MPNEFAITAAADRVTLDDQRRGRAIFTVSNMTSRQLRARALVVPVNAEAASWFTISEPERDIPVAVTQQFAVEIAAPPAALPGDYTFRLDVVGVENPDEQYAQGPGIIVAVPAPPLPAKKPFPWWILAVAGAAAVLLIALVAVLLIVRDDDEGAVGAVIAEGNLQLGGDTFVDLEDGTVQAGGQEPSGADFKVNNQNIQANAIEPLNDAQIRSAGTTPPGAEGCAELPLESQPIPLEQLTIGNHFCIRTSDGNLSEWRIDSVFVLRSFPPLFGQIQSAFRTFED